MRPGQLSGVLAASCRSVKDHRNVLKYSPHLKKTCVRQVVLDNWFPLSQGSFHAFSRRLGRGRGATLLPKRPLVRGPTGVCKKRTPPEKKTHGRISFESTKSGGEEQLMLLGCLAKACVKRVLCSQTPVCTPTSTYLALR